MKSGAPVSKQHTTAHLPVHPYARRESRDQPATDKKKSVSRFFPPTQPHRFSNLSYPPRSDVKVNTKMDKKQRS